MNEGMQNLIEIDELENKVYQYKLKEKKMRQLISNVFWDLKRDINKGMNIEDIYFDVGYMSSLCVIIGKRELGQKINDKFIQQKGRLTLKLEDKHIQLTMDKSLMNYDLILRTNDNGTKYIAFDIFDYDKQQIIKTIKINEGNNE